MPRNHATVRREAFLDAIAWLEYRAVACRVAEDHYSVENGHPPISSATERSARHELELAIREITKLAGMRRVSREFKAAVAERQRYVREMCPPTYRPGRGGRASIPGLAAQEGRDGES